jgi:NitT/TauT family transport system permease protein
MSEAVVSKPETQPARERGRARPPRTSAGNRGKTSVVIFWRVAILVVFLLCWQFLPKSHVLSEHVRFLNTFFISSPSEVFHRVVELMTGRHNSVVVWSYLIKTLEATLIGTVAGLAIGCLFGALFSNNETLSRIFSVYITVVNSIPRIALIPVVVLIVGPGLKSTIVASILVVSFLGFFNAYEGGRSVALPVLQNAWLLRANSRQIMFRVRFPYVLMWTFAVVPNAISFGLITVVTTELLTGSKGMGGLILNATTNVDASLSLAVAFILAVVGTVLVLAADRLKRRILHWAN